MVASTPPGSPRSASKSRYCCGSRPAVRATASPSRTNLRMRWRSSASAWYSAVVISFAMKQLYRNAIYVVTSAEPAPPANLSFQPEGRRFLPSRSGEIPLRNSRLQRFAKGFLRFVMLVAVAFVELVRAFAKYVRAHGHALTAMLARPIFGGGQQQR